MNRLAIRSVRAWEILDGRLEPMLQVAVGTEGGHAGRSTGSHEAVERRDGGDRARALPRDHPQRVRRDLG